MNRRRPERVRELFEKALDLPEEARDGFLEKECGPDRDLQVEVRSLLEAHVEAGGFLGEGEVARALAELPVADEDPLVGTLIGGYRILGVLGRGGMGAVYRAEQENPRREVALKLIDRSVLTPGLLRRFEVEAQLLARLKHPGIAQIHVAGTSGEDLGNRPYFAMELIDGLPLTAFADEQGLDLHERLELLIKVCEAVQHAHQFGVIHRDLKPANILVTQDGQPKILDFGVARSTDADLQVTTWEEGHAALIGTLPYMSPEQVRGNPDELDTRSDVHALGVIAYELLTGRLPRNLENKSVTDAIRTIVDEEPRSLRAAGNGSFPADLETIVAKALESDRRRRYDSASRLADDLQRYLDGQPISARPQSAIYQLRKLVARNRLPATLVAGLVFLAVASAVVFGIQARRTAGERDRANIEAGTATQVSAFLESLFLEADPEQALGTEWNARDLLDRGAERIQTELLDQPAVRGRLLAIVGKVYDGLGLPDRAEPLLEEAVAIGRGLREEYGDPIDRSNLELALYLLARCRAAEGRNEEAIALCREAVEWSGIVNGEESAPYATCLNHLAYQLALVPAHIDEARELNRRGLALREKLFGPMHVDVGWSVYQYAWMLRMAGENEAAKEQFARACSIWEEVLPENHPQLARCLVEYSKLLGTLEEYEEALTLALRALEIQRKTLGPEHPAIADTLNDIGNTYWRMGNLPEARRHFSAAVDAHRIAPGPADPGMLSRLYTLAFVDTRMNNPEAKEKVLLEALDLARKYHGDAPAVVAEALGKVALLYGAMGRLVEARPLLEETTELLDKAGKSDSPDQVTILNALAVTLETGDAAEQSLRVNRRILALRLEHPDWTRPNPLFVRYRIGLDLVRLERFDEAEACFRELLPDVEGAFSVNAFFPWNIRWMLGHCRHALGYEDDARAFYDAVLAVDPQTVSEELHWLRLRRAEEHGANGRLEEAAGELRAALASGLDPVAGEIAVKLNPRLHPDLRRELLEVLGER